MKHTEIEIKNLKLHLSQMWSLVEGQLRKSFDAVVNHDIELAHEVITREKSVNAQELVVDHHCENFIALFNPVAIDLRFVLSLLKINNNLERIGDFAESLALFVHYDQTKPLDAELAKQLQIKKMFDTVMRMMEQARVALSKEDGKLASHVLGLDDTVDTINREALGILAAYIVAHPEQAREVMGIHTVVRRIERMGDRLSNIAEDIVFYVDAKEMRHRSGDFQPGSADVVTEPVQPQKR